MLGIENQQTIFVLRNATTRKKHNINKSIFTPNYFVVVVYYELNSSVDLLPQL